MVKKLNVVKIKGNAGVGVFHDTRGDVNKLAKVCNELIEKINELVDKVNELETK